MQLANQEAHRFNHEYIGTEHILLALLRLNEGIAAVVLQICQIDFRRIRLHAEKLIHANPEMSALVGLPQTPRAKKVIEYAIEESRNLHHEHVGTEHILLGLLRENEGFAAQILMNHGMDIDTARAVVVKLLPPGSASEYARKKSIEQRLSDHPEVQELKRRIDALRRKLVEDCTSSVAGLPIGRRVS